MVTLNNVAVGDAYTDAATLGPNVNAQQIVFSVANFSAIMQVANAAIPVPDWGSELLITPTQGASITRAMGVRFRNAVPGSIARVVAAMSQSSDPLIQAGTSFTGTLAPSGSVTPVAVTKQLSRTNITAPVVVSGTSNTTEGTAVIVLGTAALTFDGVTTIEFRVGFPGTDSSIGGANGHVSIFDNAVSLGEIGGLLSNVPKAGVLYGHQVTPAAGAHTFTVGLWVTGAGAGNTFTFKAGLGGPGNLVPGFFEVWSVGV